MKKALDLFGIIALMAVMVLTVAACSGKKDSGKKDSGSGNGSGVTGSSNPFVGTWDYDDKSSVSEYSLTVYTPDNPSWDGFTWKILYGEMGMTANAGSYTVNGSTATWTVEKKEYFGLADEGTTGTATIEGNKLIGWAFKDTFTKSAK